MQLMLHFASGDSFFVGLVLLVVATSLRLVRRHLRLHTFLRMLSVIGIAFVVGSATPLPLWQYLLWFALIVGIHIALDKQMLTPTIRRILVLGLFCFSLALGLGEYSYRQVPAILIANDDTVYVIGDSISSGLDEGEQPWPQVLADLTGLRIVNLARSGATIATALQQAALIQDHNAIVFVEIGGNDFFDATNAATFARHLDRLLYELHSGGHRIVLFELPLLPLYNRFGRAQRISAQTYNAQLIPKTVLAEILGMRDGTTDGIHLSQQGHQALAERIREFISKGKYTEGRRAVKNHLFSPQNDFGVKYRLTRSEVIVIQMISFQFIVWCFISPDKAKPNVLSYGGIHLCLEHHRSLTCFVFVIASSPGSC